MAVIDAPAEGHRRKGPFYSQLYFQVLFAIFAGGLIGAFFPLWHTAPLLDAVTGQPAIDPATLKPLTHQVVVLRFLDAMSLVRVARE